MGSGGKLFAVQRAAVDPKRRAPSIKCRAWPGHQPGKGRLKVLSSGGLEVRLPDGAWAACTPKKGEFVVNLGDMMARWANERWTSNLHRVANPPLARAQSRRLSIGLFVHPNYDQAIACVPTCLAPGETPRYPVIGAGEHIKRKIERSHEGA